MAPRYSDEVLVTLNSVNAATDFEFPDRQVLLSKHNSSHPIGRTSKRDSAYFAHSENCWFDSPVMSREHAELRLDADTQTVTIADRSSLHGTYLNNHQVQKDTPLELKNDDKITLGVTIDKGTTKFAPCVFKVNIQPGTDSRPAVAPTVFRVPDDSDMEDVDSENFHIQQAIEIIEESGLRPNIMNSSSTFDAVDLTQDEPSMSTGSEDRPIDLSASYASSVQDFDGEMTSPQQSQLPIVEQATISQVDGNLSDSSGEVSSQDASASAQVGLETLLRLDDEDENDVEHPESDYEDEYSSEIDESLSDITNESVCGSEEEFSENENIIPVAEPFLPSDPTLGSSTGGAVADMECVRVPKTPTPDASPVDFVEDDSIPVIQTFKAPVLDHATSPKYPNSNISDSEGLTVVRFTDHNTPPNSKPNVRQMKFRRMQTPPQRCTNISEGLSEEASRHDAAGTLPTPQSLKRKAADISVLSPEEEQSQPAVLFQGPVSNEQPSSGTSHSAHPVKRLRRLAEVAGFAALGGVAVMGALIATAPVL